MPAKTAKTAKARPGNKDVARIWRDYQRTRSTEHRNQLVEYYMPLVHKLAEIIARRLWPRVTAEELASAGYDGLIGAVTSFDPKRGVKFETFCRQRILGAIRDWQRIDRTLRPKLRTGRDGCRRSLQTHRPRPQPDERAPYGPAAEPLHQNEERF